jgi:hypothetical protein
MGLAFVGWLALVRMVPAGGFWARIVAAFARGRHVRRGNEAARPAPKFRDDPLADALPIQAVLDGAAGRDATPRGTPGHRA